MKDTVYLLKIANLLVVSVVCWVYAFHLYSQSLVHVEVSSATGSDSILRGPSVRKAQNSSALMSNGADNLFHFVQITDIHVSKYHKVGGLAHLEAFLFRELPLIAPDLVLSTGDLTDAKASHALTSLQQLEEWVAYHKALHDSKVLERNGGQFYWDQRGNHDCWNIPGFNSSENFYVRLGAVGKEGYYFVLDKSFGKYSFIAVDGCPATGTGRPLNFFGVFDTEDMEFFKDALQQAVAENHNHTFAMSHYPIGTTYYGTTKSGLSFTDLTHHVTVWLSGHLHKLAGGLGETMYAFQKDKVLELELGDMKKHGLFRIIAVDNDLMSFVDIPIHAENLPIPKNAILEVESFQRPPIVMITNPKDGRYTVPNKEPSHLIQSSTHIRALIWSTNEITSLQAIIDDEIVEGTAEYNGIGKPWASIQNVDQTETHIPLWTIPWDASKYSDHLIHHLTVIAKDAAGFEGNHSVRFRVDGERISEMDSGPGGFIISLPLGTLVRYSNSSKNYL